MGLDVAQLVQNSLACEYQGVKTYLIFSSELYFTMGEMTAMSFDTIFVLLEMLAQCSLIEVVELLATLLLLGLHVSLLVVLWAGLAGWGLSLHFKVFSRVLLLYLLHLLKQKVKTRLVVKILSKFAILRLPVHSKGK